MSAQLIFDAAPLGALVRFSDGQPKPAPRFGRKLAAWEHKNSIGRLVRKEPATRRGHHVTPASITLHRGNFGCDGVVVVMAYMTYSVTSALVFEIIERPVPGAVRVLHLFGAATELLCLAPDWSHAEAWLHANPYRRAILEPVKTEDMPLTSSARP
jgi:hypothetical protein